ncbi:MAG: 16S rRNA (uracil(1498)-N(3))-methyltransferase, partial [Firmicutes bacterium]|nr:16S rRNA (uracil(1498)-N(3))-methyltransferase [Bacillota bacterium]
IESLRRCHAIIAGLGPRVLRAETAAVVGLALVQAQLGDLLGERS